MGAPPPEKLVADWLPMPPEEPEPPEETVVPEEVPGLEPGPVVGVVEDPRLNPEFELPPVRPEPPVEPIPPDPIAVPPTVDPGWPETMEEAAPIPPAAPGSPARGLPKKPFTVVLASPRWIRRQSALPVMGSVYFCRKKRMFEVFSSWSTAPG